jgi:hypothetical protein
MKEKLIKINRLGNTVYNNEVSENNHLTVDRIKLEYNGEKYTITPDFDGKLRIHAHGNELSVFPCVANEILVKGRDR